jgi:hypothetical protein
MAIERRLAAVLARLFQSAAIVIFVVIAVAVAALLTGRNVAVWIDSGGLPSIESGPHAQMAIPISGTLSLGQNGASVDRVRGLLHFEGGPATIRIANTAIVVLLLAAACWILLEFRGLFVALRERQFFLPANAARIRRVGWAVIAGEIVRAAIVCFETTWARDHFTVEGLRLESHFQINGFAILCGLMILVLAGAFREGTRLQDEASLTI